MSAAQEDFLSKARAAAQAAGHPFSGAAAAEAAVESAWGTSDSATKHNNLLGIRKPLWWKGATFTLATKEQRKDGTWYTDPNARWAAFDSWEECFLCQLRILRSSAAYLPALQATTAEAYISAVSQVWATGKERGKAVMQTYHAHLDVLLDPARSTLKTA